MREVETTRRRKWEAPEHHGRIVDQFTRFPVLHDLVISMGYEPDRSWFDPIREAYEARVASGEIEPVVPTPYGGTPAEAAPAAGYGTP